MQVCHHESAVVTFPDGGECPICRDRYRFLKLVLLLEDGTAKPNLQDKPLLIAKQQADVVLELRRGVILMYKDRTGKLGRKIYREMPE
jgi:hypothetical protein